MPMPMKAPEWHHCPKWMAALWLAASCSSQAADFIVYSAEFPSLAESTATGAKGLYVDLLEQVERKTGHRFIWRFQPWARAQLSAQTDPSGLIANFTRTPERESRYQWVGVLGWGRYGVFIPRKSAARTLADLQDDTIGYLNGSDVQGVLQQAGFKKLEPATAGEFNARKLHLGRLGGWAINLWTGPSIYLKNGFALDELRVIPLNDAWDQWLAASPSFPPQAAEQIGAALVGLQREGVVKTLETKYWQSIAGMPNPTVAKGK